MNRLTAVPKDSLSYEEIEQLDGETASRALIAGRLMASHPRLIPHAVSTAARGALRGAASAVKADPALGWMAAADQVHRIAPGAVFGADWGGLETFVATFGDTSGRTRSHWKSAAAVDASHGGCSLWSPSSTRRTCHKSSSTRPGR